MKLGFKIRHYLLYGHGGRRAAGGHGSGDSACRNFGHFDFRHLCRVRRRLREREESGVSVRERESLKEMKKKLYKWVFW